MNALRSSFREEQGVARTPKRVSGSAGQAYPVGYRSGGAHTASFPLALRCSPTPPPNPCSPFAIVSVCRLRLLSTRRRPETTVTPTDAADGVGKATVLLSASPMLRCTTHQCSAARQQRGQQGCGGALLRPACARRAGPPRHAAARSVLAHSQKPDGKGPPEDQVICVGGRRSSAVVAAAHASTAERPSMPPPPPTLP